MVKRIIKHINEEVIRKIYNSIAFDFESHRAHDSNIWDLIEMPLLEKINKNLDNKIILDAGCGTGILIEYLRKKCNPKKIVGVDISEEMLKIAEKRCVKLNNNITLLRGSIKKIDVKNNSFDVIYSLNVLHYVEYLEEVLSEFYRVLKNKGKLVFAIRHPVRNLSYMLKKDDASYFERGWHQEKWPGTGNIAVYHFYRPMDEWINALIKTKFIIKSVYETKPDDKIKMSHPDFYDKYTKIPRELLFIVQK